MNFFLFHKIFLGKQRSNDGNTNAAWMNSYAAKYMLGGEPGKAFICLVHNTKVVLVLTQPCS